MKQVLSHAIILIPGTDPFDSRYLFRIATDVSAPFIVDLAEILKEFRNDRVEYRTDYKLWNQVYATEKELELFRWVLEQALADDRKVHIINCSLREEVQMVRELYEKLGYFDVSENRFVVPFATAPVTIGVNIRNLAYSTKDYKSKRESICFIPPPREPGHIKTLFAAINSWVVSTVSVNDFTREEELFKTLLDTEKINLTTLAQVLCGNCSEMGCLVGKMKEWIAEL